MKVTILVFPGVEELDFVGFLEVLAVANRSMGMRWFDTQLVGTTKSTILCSGGLKVVPDTTVRSAVVGDMIFVPGGGSSRETGVDVVARDERVLRVLRTAERQGKLVWSVCTGALVLGSAGLLKGRKAVTHHSVINKLQDFGAKPVRKRTVTDGKITTGGGISSSIDVGLELVRIKLGERVASDVRKRMEYYPPPRNLR